MLDNLDLMLLHELEENGVQTQASLGRKLGAAEATIRRREHRLLNRHVLRLLGVPNLSALGYDLIASIGLNVDFSYRDGILSSLIATPRVRYVASCTGRYEILLCVASCNREDLSTFLEELTSTRGVLHIETFLNLKVMKNQPWVLDDAEALSRSDEALADCGHQRKGASLGEFTSNGTRRAKRGKRPRTADGGHE